MTDVMNADTCLVKYIAGCNSKGQRCITAYDLKNSVTGWQKNR